MAASKSRKSHLTNVLDRELKEQPVEDFGEANAATAALSEEYPPEMAGSKPGATRNPFRPRD